MLDGRFFTKQVLQEREQMVSEKRNPLITKVIKGHHSKQSYGPEVLFLNSNIFYFYFRLESARSYHIRFHCNKNVLSVGKTGSKQQPTTTSSTSITRRNSFGFCLFTFVSWMQKKHVRCLKTGQYPITSCFLPLVTTYILLWLIPVLFHNLTNFSCSITI